MIDIDHFKSINDRHGHRTGDEVLHRVAAVLRQSLRTTDIVCRFGGEEFCVLLPDTTTDDGLLVAEKLRGAVAGASIGGISVTASFGVATALDDQCKEELIEHADQALYAAKASGRNRSVRHDRQPSSPTPALRWASLPREPRTAPDIPLDAVNALLSALSYRDPMTGAHSRRVADLSVALASNLMPPTECFVLEVAALLHDLGKIGVPGSILLKPGPLTPEEWKVMSDHDRIGVEIINSGFQSHELTMIVRYHHAFFGGSERYPQMPKGADIPLRARILSIADAYDAMTSERPYRKAKTAEEAVAELRRCAGTQFDPWLVERFVAVLEVRVGGRRLHSLPESLDHALRVGIEAERLMAAFDANDLVTLGVVTARLAAVASSIGLDRIAQLATELSEALQSTCDAEMALSSLRELLDLCRSTQTELLSKLDRPAEEVPICTTSS